jgi:hypothetical protein
LYGGTATGPTEDEAGARPIIFRIKPDGTGFQVVYKFDGPDDVRVVTIGNVDSNGAIFALATWTNGTVQPQSRFYRIQGGQAIPLADVADQFSDGAPVALPDSSLASVLSDPGSCSVTGLSVSTIGRIRNLFKLEGTTRRDGRCYADDVPFSAPAASGSDLFAFNPTQLIKITNGGIRTVVAQLPTNLGHFVAAPARDGLGNTLALAADARSAICLRLLRIDSQGHVEIVHEFARSEDRCIEDEDDIMPRLGTASDGSIVFATQAEGGCAKQLSNSETTKDGPSCGSIIGIERDGSVAFVHDFEPSPVVTDSGAPSVRYIVSGERRTLRVSFVRSPPGLEPFQVDFSRLSMRLTASDAHVFTVRGNGERVSHRDTRKDEVLVYANADVVDASFPLPASLPADMYRVLIDANGALRNANNEQLAVVPGISTISVYIPALSSNDVEAMRRRYLGKTLGASGLCRDNEGNLASFQSTSARVVDIRRTDRSEVFSGTPLGFAGLFEFRSIDPIVFTFVGLTTNRQDIVNAAPDRHDPEHPTCPKVTMTVVDAWQADRAFNAPAVSPLWPSRFQRAIKAYTPLVGMTPEMVVATWGFPSAFGTLEQLKRLSHWEYAAPAPSEHFVDFKKGHVSSVTLPRRNP